MALIILYFAYFIYCLVKTFDFNDEGAMRFLIVTILATVFIVSRLIIRHWLEGKEFYLRILDEMEEEAKIQKLKNG